MYKKLFISKTFYFLGILELQSSMNISENLGTISVSVLYASALLICLFIAPVLLLQLGAKWGLVIGQIGFTFFTIGNFYPGTPQSMFYLFGTFNSSDLIVHLVFMQ